MDYLNAPVVGGITIKTILPIAAVIWVAMYLLRSKPSDKPAWARENPRRL